MMNRTILFACCLTSLLALAPVASATTYYVRTDGNDSNPGTGSDTANAWATVIAATTKSLSPGDVVYIQAGTYPGPVEPTVDGTSGSPITFIADKAGSVSGWSVGNVIIQAPVGEHALHVSYDDYLTFSDFLFEGDSGRNTVGVDNGTGTVLQRCEIYDGLIGIDIDDADATIINCLVRDNALDGISLDVGTVTVYQCTIVNNGSDGIDIGNYTGTVFNSIISGNGGFGFSRQSDGDGTMTHFFNLLYSNTSGNYSGTIAGFGEISVDPLFVSSTDFHLRSTSPARDVGGNLAGTVDDDFHGNPRPENGSWDMGFHAFGSTSGSTPLLFVTQNSGYFTTQERYRKTMFEAWGYAVTAIAATDSQANYDTALSSARVVYVSEQVISSNVSYKLREATIGVVNEEKDLTDEFGFSTSWSTTSNTGLSVVNGTHYITSPFGVSTVTILTTGSESLYLSGTQATGLEVLGQWGSSNSLAVVDAGGTLVNTYNSSYVALGRRVQLPFADNGFDWNWLTEDGQTMVQRALAWAFGGLVGHWKLDETSGTVAADSSSFGNDGSLTNGPSWDTGIIGGGLSFDGSNDYINVPYSANLSLTGKMSFAAWVNTLDTSGGYKNILSTDVPGNGKSNYWFGIENDELVFGFWASGGFRVVTSPSSNLQTGEWYHLAASFDDATDVVRLYVDGIEVHVGTLTYSPTTETAELWVGHSVDGEYWNGNLDDVRIYNRELTTQEVAELYGLMGHWKLDETSGTVAADATVFGNDGTYTNGPTLGNCGPYENAANFDGVNDHVDLPDMDIDYSQGFSAAVWMRPSADPNTFYALFGTANGVSDDEIWFGYVGTFLELYVSDTTDGSASHVLLDNSAAVLNEWQHCVVTIDASGIGKLYRNGVETASGFVSLPANVLRGDNFIGKSVFNDEFPGELDDVRVYNRALTARQVAELYGLVGHWKLDETSGTLAADATIFGNDGTYINGVTLDRSGTVNRSADFDGTNDYVGVADSTSLQMDDYFSMTAWIRADNSTNVNQMIINKEGEYEVAVFPDDQIYWGLTNTDPGWSWHATGHFVTNGVWTHIAVTYNNATIKTYADGVLVDTYVGSGPIGDNYTLLNELHIGGRQNNPTGKNFDGRIDDVKVYARSLCPEEVQDLYDGGTIPGVRIIKWVEVE